MVADETLFWPVGGDGSTPSWPYLENISIMFHMSTPSGSWYFRGLPGVGATEGFDVDDAYPPHTTIDRDAKDDDEICNMIWEHNCASTRSPDELNDEILVPFLVAFGKATTISMPSLKEFKLRLPLRFYLPADIDVYQGFDSSQVSTTERSYLTWGIAYTRPGMKAFITLPGENFSEHRHLWWLVGEWRPTPELHQSFQKIGERQGEGLAEYLGDENAVDAWLHEIISNRNTIGFRRRSHFCKIDSLTHVRNFQLCKGTEILF
ncbi:hypothetical protein BS50DRAFT_644411 [Corynespora cassiicola Philippines]|uniref:Uncharacterized protein n=1 Tax=Corynespora cassiicola Philippines TaxID=1448308 RepID=A0A2T2PCZ1_CORCC|nr:hypothetical protein BS50DRAFT_644411 [Corynespora cassiicola Philippines]